MSKAGRASILLGLLLLVLVIPAALLLLAPSTAAGLIKWGIRSSTGLHADINDLQLDLFPPRLASGAFKLSNPTVETGEFMLALDRFVATVDVGRWWKDTPAWWTVSASGVVVHASTDEQGISNWYLGSDQSFPKQQSAEPDHTKGGAGPGPLFSFDSITVTDLNFFRSFDGETHQLHVANLSLRKDADERLKIELQANYRDQPLTASGTLALPSSERARQVDFQASIFGSELRLEGMVGHDGIAPGEARISVQFKDLTTVSRLLNQDLSVFTPVILEGTLTATKQGSWELASRGELGGREFDLRFAAKVNGPIYALDRLNLSFADSSIKANGRLDKVAKTATLTVSAPHIDVNQVLEFTRREDKPRQAFAMPINVKVLSTWAVRVDAQVADLLYEAYRLRDLTVELVQDSGELQARAGLESITAATSRTVRDMAAVKQPGSKLRESGEGHKGNASDEGNKNAHSDDPSPTSGEDDKKFAWALVEPLMVKARLQLTPADNARGWPVTAQFNSRGLQGKLDATIPASAVQPLEGNLRAQIDSLSAVQGLEEARWDAFLPLKLEISAHSEQSELALDPINISVDGSDVNGKLNIDRAQSPIYVSGEVHSKKLDINQFSTTSVETIQSSGQELDKDSGDVIGDQPIDWSWLEAANIDLDVKLDKFVFNQTKFRNMQSKVLLKDARLAVDPIKADLAKGGIRGYVHVRQDADSAARIDTRLIATGVTPADLGQENEGLIDGGETDVLIDVRTSGATPQELAAALDGEIALEIERADIRNSLFEVIGSDILLQTVNLINPFAKKDKRMALECAAVFFKAVDGVLNSPDQLVIETAKMKIRGGGEIDLRKETLRIDFVPTPREGLGISLSNLASVVRLDGTLGKPQLVADPKGIFKAGATIGAAVATGGVSLLAQGLFDRARSAAGGTACGKIFENVPEADIPSAKSSAVD